MKTVKKGICKEYNIKRVTPKCSIIINVQKQNDISLYHYSKEENMQTEAALLSGASNG